MKKKKCETCNGEGVAWLLSPCPDCKLGKKVKRIGERITKDLKENKIIRKPTRNKRKTKEVK